METHRRGRTGAYGQRGAAEKLGRKTGEGRRKASGSRVRGSDCGRKTPTRKSGGRQKWSRAEVRRRISGRVEIPANVIFGEIVS